MQGIYVNVDSEAVGGEDLSQIRARLPAIFAKYEGRESSTLIDFHGGGNDLDGQTWPYNATTIESGLRGCIQDCIDAGFAVAPSTLSYRQPVTGEDTEPYNDNIYLPVIAEMTPLWFDGPRSTVDMYTAIESSQGWMDPDGTHMTDEGYFHLGNYIGGALANKVSANRVLTPQDVLLFNGTSYGTMASEVALVGSFEIELWYRASVTTGALNLIASTDNRDFVSISLDTMTFNVKFDNSFNTVSSSLTADNELHCLIVRRKGSVSYVIQDGVTIGSVSGSTGAAGFDMVAVRPSNARANAEIYNIKAWTGGDRQTGTLAWDLPLNNVGSDTQTELVAGNDLTLFSVVHGTDWTTEQVWTDPELVIASPEPEPDVEPTTNDSMTTLMNEPLNIDLANDVTANDAGWGAGALTASIDTQPTNGAVIDNLDGTLTYTPNLDYSGSDSFTLSVTDGSNFAASTFTVSVVDASTLPTIAGVTLQTASTPVDGELVTLDVINAGDKPLNDQGNHAPTGLFVGKTYLTEGVETTVVETYDPPATPTGSEIDIRIDPANEYYLGKSNAISIDASSWAGDGTQQMPPLFSPEESTTPRHTGNGYPTAVIKGRGQHVQMGYLRASRNGPANGAPMLRPASIIAGQERLYGSARFSWKIDPMSYFALECGSDPSAIFNVGDDALVDITGGSGAGSQIDCVVLGTFGNWLHLSYREYTGAYSESSALSNGATPSTGIAKRDNAGDDADYGAVSVTFDNHVKAGSTKICRFRTYSSQNNDVDGTNLFGGSLTHNEMYVGIDSVRAGTDRPPQPKNFVERQGLEGLDKTTLVEVVYIRGDVSRFYLNGRLVMEHPAELHDIVTDANPGVSMWAQDNSNGDLESARFQEFTWMEMLEDVSPCRVLIANHGDLAQATHVERQYIEDWQLTEAGKIKFNLIAGELSDLSDAWVFVFDHSDKRSQYGTNLQTGEAYNPSQVGPRQYVNLLGGDDYFRFAGGNEWTSADDNWFVERDMKFSVVEDKVFFSRSTAPTCSFVLKANGTVEFVPAASVGGISVDAIPEIFDGKWWRIRAWSNGVDAGVTAARWRDDMTGFDLTVEAVIGGGTGSASINYIDRYSTTYTEGSCANININDERKYVLNGTVTTDVAELGGGAPLRQLGMTDVDNLAGPELAPPALS